LNIREKSKSWQACHICLFQTWSLKFSTVPWPKHLSKDLSALS